jgi:predicted nucleotidyltransferase
VPRLDDQRERLVQQFTADVRNALGASLRCVALYGSAAGDDWIPGRSDINTAIVVDGVTISVLDRLAAALAGWYRKGFALPLVVDPEYLRRACESFPMEIEDIRRRHRVVSGDDPFDGLHVERATLWRELEQEAHGKLVRLRAHYVGSAQRPQQLEQFLSDSIKSFLILLRHLAPLRDRPMPATEDEALSTGESLLGPLPSLRRALALRRGGRELKSGVAELARGYLEEVERLVAAISGAR